MSDNSFYIACVIGIAALLGFANFACAGLTSSERAERLAADVGLANPHVVSKGPAFGVLRGCKESDVALIKVSGQDAQGRLRTLHVCAPWPFGGYTVRG